MSKDNIEPAIFIADFPGKCIREKVMMEKPNDNDFYAPDYEHPTRNWFDSDARNRALKEYKDHVASRRSYPYPVSKEQDGKEIKESEFRLQHQIISHKLEGNDFEDYYWKECTKEVYEFESKHTRRIIAIPIEPDTPLQPVKDETTLKIKWAADLRDKISLFIETSGYKLLPSASTKILAIIYESSPPEPSSKEQEGDAVGFAEEDVRNIISMVCDQFGAGFVGREEFITKTIQFYKNKNL